MTATAMGDHARNLSGNLPRTPPPFGRTSKKPKPGLEFRHSRTGLIAYRKGTPVAWVAPGYHTGQVATKAKTVRFVDAVYHRQTLHGINLETFDCGSVGQAKSALRVIFRDAAAFSASVNCAGHSNGGTAA